MKKILYILLLIGSINLLNAVQVVSKGYSNIRETASLKAKVVGVLQKGEKVNILDSVMNHGRFWCKTEKGYVSCKLLRIEKPKKLKEKPLKTLKKVQEISKAQTTSENNNRLKEVNKFNEAKEFFLAKKYKVAYDTFYVLFLNNLSDPNINFYLGQSAFMLGRYDEAISAYERILFVDENATRAKLELARCHIANNSDELAKTIFLEVLKADIPKNVRINVQKYLKSLDDKVIKNSVNGILIVGFGWDDNIESLSTNYVSEVTDAVFVSTNSLKSAWTHQEMAALNHTYKYSDTVDFKNNGMLFLKNNVGFSKRNIQLFQYSPALSVKYSSKLSVEYALLYNRIFLNKKSLISNYAFNPKLKYINSKSLILGASLKYQQKLNDDSNNKNRDSRFYELTFNTQIVHSGKLSTMYEFKYAKEKKIRGFLTDVDYDLYNLSTAVNYKSTKDLSVSLKAKLFNKSYLDKYIPSKVKRVDDEYQGYLSATYMLSKKYILQTEYVYTNHRSNYNDFEFNKNTFAMNFISMF